MEIESAVKAFRRVSDPRREWGNFRHKLEDMLVIGLCTVICGGETFEDMEEFGENRKPWLSTFLELPNGTPDSDTFRRLFERIDSRELSECLNQWLQEAEQSGGRLVNIDGKTICGSKKGEEHKALHVVSAWVHENEMVLGELAVAEKSNEITAIPALLDLIDVEGDIVTIDAMGCQTDIAEKIQDKKADYILAVKENQPTLHEEISGYFSWLEREQPRDEAFDGWESPVEKGHGRIEKREVKAIGNLDWLESRRSWSGLKTILQYRCTRTENGQTSIVDRYYISSFDTSAEQFAYLLRNHWSIENRLHWMLDVVFREDDARAKKNHSPLNLNILRKTALACLKRTPAEKRASIHRKMLRASLNPDFLHCALFQK
jgi:predicted transposase YbfD/YdcC